MTRMIVVSDEQVESAKALVAISGGPDKVEPLIARSPRPSRGVARMPTTAPLDQQARGRRIRGWTPREESRMAGCRHFPDRRAGQVHSEPMTGPTAHRAHRLALAGTATLLGCTALGLAPTVARADPSAAAPGHRAKPFDLDGDGHGELAVGEPWSRGGGKVSILRGTSTGVTASGSKEITQATPGVAGADEDRDHWGRAVTSGDFDRDGRADLVVGALQNWVDDDPAQGAVTIIRGGPGGAPGHGSRVVVASNDDDILGRRTGCR